MESSQRQRSAETNQSAMADISRRLTPEFDEGEDDNEVAENADSDEHDA